MTTGWAVQQCKWTALKHAAILAAKTCLRQALKHAARRMDEDYTVWESHRTYSKKKERTYMQLHIYMPQLPIISKLWLNVGVEYEAISSFHLFINITKYQKVPDRKLVLLIHSCLYLTMFIPFVSVVCRGKVNCHISWRHWVSWYFGWSSKWYYLCISRSQWVLFLQCIQ